MAAQKKNDQQKQYNDQSIKALKGADRVRKRPGVIFGSDGLEGCEHSFFEILSNSVDEARDGHGNEIKVTAYRDHSIEVDDHGRGVPLGWNEAEGRWNWDLIYCELYAGGKYDNNSDSNYGYSLGLNGLGACATQYASEYMDVTVHRDGFKYQLHFEKGEDIGGLSKEQFRHRHTMTKIRWKPDIDVFTGLPFKTDKEYTMADITAYISTLPAAEQQQYNAYIQQMKMKNMTDEQIVEKFATAMQNTSSSSTYEENLAQMGVADLDDPSAIYIYPKDFEAKENITAFIDSYNKDAKESEKITFTDYIGLMMSSVTTIINAISYILIAFVSISLVVSSIMIGIITYISVLERTKEIGILRAMGASKKDISRVFNAETLIVGFAAGFIGIAVTLLLLIPINAIIEFFTDIGGLAVLPTQGAIILVIISMLLTFIAGLIPSRIAAKKDPVTALRTE